MSLATPDVQTEAAQSSYTGPVRKTKHLDSGRYRVDPIGVLALVVAGAGLAGTLMLLRAPSADSTTTATVHAQSVSIAPARDQWYLESSASQAAQPPALTTSVMKDRWYEDPAAASGTPARP